MSELDKTPNDLVVMQGQSLAEATDDIIASAERRIASVQKILELSLKITTPNDWVDQNDKPYLTASGAEKVARLFGVSWKDIRSEKIKSEDEKGPFYFYQVSGLFTIKHDSILAVGTCSSKDQFFAKKKEKNEAGETVTVLKPLSEVDETNIMKAAYTNCVVNGVTRLLGLRGLTWEMVGRSGILKESVASVKYAGGGAGGGKISEAQGKRLYAIMKASGKTVEQLKEHLLTVYKIEHSADIGWKDYQKITDWLESK